MDAHFVPNLTFGAKTIKHLRKRTELPFDAHLMISEPGRYLDEYLDAGCDSITFHVEIEEAIEPTLRAIRAAGRAAGLAVKPGTPLSALEPYRELLDIVLVMTVEPGFGGQSFMKDVAGDKLLARARPAQPQGVRRRGPRRRRDQSRDRRVRRRARASTSSSSARRCSSRAATWAARSGSSARSPTRATSTRLNDGVPPIPRDRMVTFTSLPEAPRPAVRWTRSRRAACPVVMLRGDGQMNPDGVRDYDLLVPAIGRGGRRRAPRRGAGQASSATPRRGATAFIAEHGVIPTAQPPVRALLQRTTGARVRVDGEVVGEIGPGLVVLLGVGPDDNEAVADELARRVAELRIFRDDDGPDEPVAARRSAARRSSSRSSRSTRTRAAAAGRGSPAPRAPELAERLYLRFAAALRGARRDGGDRAVRGRDGGRARQRRPVHDLARHRGPLAERGY